MAEILGLGVTHSPPMCGIDSRMAGIAERVLQSPKLPDRMRDPANWPDGMRHEWDEHRAGRAAPAHRERVVAGFRRARAALEAFNPDFVVIFGDDQYENFREDGVAPFCVFALDEVESHPFHRSGAANAWGEPADTVVRTKGIWRARWWSRGSIPPGLTACGTSTGCRTPSSTRCCCWTTTGRVCPGRWCRFM